MEAPLQWNHIEDIAFALFEREPTLNPLTVRFTDLRDKILALPNFVGEREKCNEKILEAVQMAWLEEFEDED
jgi:FeS assembly protein IscX